METLERALLAIVVSVALAGCGRTACSLTAISGPSEIEILSGFRHVPHRDAEGTVIELVER